jgi:small GTP-binding protein
VLDLLQIATDICDRALAELTAGPVRDGVADVRRRLGEPPRVAVVGRVSSGKSTLVNALLGLRIAPTAAGECTRVVTWIRYGDVDRATVRLRDGSELPLRLTPERALPERLGVPAERVAGIEVSLYNAALERLTIVDTPGMESLSHETSERTYALMFGDSRRAASEVDALIHVLSGDMRADDTQVLERFRDMAGTFHPSAANAVAVLTKVDKLGRTREEMLEVAGRLVARFERELGSDVAAVVPVIGLLAEAAAAGRLSERHAQGLRRLAALEPDETRRAMRTARRHAQTGDADPETGAVLELLEMIDAYGVSAATEAVRRGVTGARGLSEHLRELSGLVRLDTTLRERFAANGARLKAQGALHALARLQDPTDRRNAERLAAALRRSADAVAVHADARWMRALEVLSELNAGTLALPAPLGDDVRRVALGGAPAQRLGLDEHATAGTRRQAALAGVTRWRTFRHDGRRSPDEDRAAQVMTLAYSALARDPQ